MRQREEPFERDPGACNYKNRKEAEGCSEAPKDWTRHAASEEGPERLSHDESLDLAEKLPRAKVTLGVMEGIPWNILKVPEGYERLTLDGKIAYLGQNRISSANPRVPPVRLSVADPRVRYLDGKCAAVGPGNSPLGGKDVDRIWINEEEELTLNGRRLDPEHEIVQQYDMLPFEDARFVRQNFPKDKFEGGSTGSKYSPDGEGDGGKGKGKGKAKAQSIEEVEDGLTFAQQQAMDLQMDHDLLQVSDQMIRDWWEQEHWYAGPSVTPSIEYMSKLYWLQNNGKGPGVGDYGEFGSRAPKVPNSNPDSEQTGDTVIHHDVGNGDFPDTDDTIDDQYAKAEEARRERIWKDIDRMWEEWKAKLKLEEEQRARQEEVEKAEKIKALREALRKGDEAMREDRRAREKAREEARGEAMAKGRPGRKMDGKGNGKGNG